MEPLGLDLPLYDMTTGTGDFVSDGVISHNCFARPTHEYLGLDIGEDFEKRIVVKINAVERLRAELRSPKWSGRAHRHGHQHRPVPARRGQVPPDPGDHRASSRSARNPFSILTKSTLILRDTAALAAAVARTDVAVNFSVGCLDRSVWRLTEPGTPPPDQRLAAVRRLTEAGISCGVLVAPVLPGLSDSDDQLRAVVEAAADGRRGLHQRGGPASAGQRARALPRVARAGAAGPRGAAPGALPRRRLPGPGRAGPDRRGRPRRRHAAAV